MVGQGADVNAKSRDGNTVLHHAAANGLVEVVRYLVEEQRLDVNATDNYGVTALRVAAEGGSLEVVRYLVEEQGLDVNATDSIGRWLCTGRRSAVIWRWFGIWSVRGRT